MTSIDGKTVGDQYLPSYLSISSWYSPSRCHIQIQSPSTPLKVSAAWLSILDDHSILSNRRNVSMISSLCVCVCVCRLAKKQKSLSNPPAPVTSPCTTRWHPEGTSSNQANNQPTWRHRTEEKGRQSPLTRTSTLPTCLPLPRVRMFLSPDLILIG